MYQERLSAVEQKERASAISDSDKARFIESLRKLVEKDMISAQKAFELIDSVESGKMKISTAYNLICHLMISSKDTRRN